MMADHSGEELFSEPETTHVMRTSGSSDEEEEEPRRSREQDMALLFHPRRKLPLTNYTSVSWWGQVSKKEPGNFPGCFPQACSISLSIDHAFEGKSLLVVNFALEFRCTNY